MWNFERIKVAMMRIKFLLRFFACFIFFNPFKSLYKYMSSDIPVQDWKRFQACGKAIDLVFVLRLY